MTQAKNSHRVPIYFIDTFISSGSSGNPTAVCLLNKTYTNNLLLSIAQKQGVPVTAFIQFKKDQPNTFSIRYFTATKEIPACGHATLAAAKLVDVLFSVEANSFITIENTVINTAISEDIIIMTYPKLGLTSFSVTDELLHALQLTSCSSSGFCKELETLFIELSDPELLKSVQPDFKRLMESNDVLKEVVITAVSNDTEYDFLLRSFCPWIGIDEDPVTGSVHSVLAGFWKQKLGKNKLKAFQASPGGGEVYVTALEDKVHIGGKTKLTHNKINFFNPI